MSSFKAQQKNAVMITKRRLGKTLIAFSLFLAYLLYNLISLQLVNSAYYKDKVYEQITTESAMKAKRGTIYDANMNILATDKTVWRIFVSTREIRKRNKQDNIDYTDIICSGLSDILGMSSSDLYKKISGSKLLDVTVKKGVEEDKYKQIISFVESNGLLGMVCTEAQTSRYYPFGTLAAHTLGFVGSDLQGLYGLEYSYNSTLQGKDGSYLYAKDANGNSLPIEYSTYIPPSDGLSIVTTIDHFVQESLEEQLEAARINHLAQNRVTGIVMDTKTGAILAMATTSPFDPNSPYELDTLSQIKLDASGFEKDSEEYKKYKKELLEILWSNKAISETYEPGSTFKIVTVAAALDAGTAKVSDKFSCHGYLAIGGWHIKCHKAGGHGSGFDLAYGLQMSCNPTMMTVAERLGAENFYNYVRDFGYFEKTGIDLPSEASTIFHKQENIGPTELATASFGQRFKVSVIRHLVSLSAIANGGRLVTPYLVSKIVDSEGKTVEEFGERPSRQVVSAEVANTVADILEKGVSGNGGAKNAAVSGYKIAAKTGTSQKFDILDENGNSYLRIGSTMAFSMSDDGGIAVIIVVDEPTSAVKYGSVVAAPYVSAFLGETLPYLGYISETETPYVEIGNYVGQNIADAKKKLSELGIRYEILGGTDTVIAQTPSPLDPFIKENGCVILYTDEESAEYVTVPDIVGMNLYEANAAIINSGLNLRIEGANDREGGATVVAQSLPPGSVVTRNSIIELKILYLDFED
ncbi:MAG: PASTA domain-containing protein [Ruminococcaceae bacterium]|nr:PASTA domain-containing protein [Oscillospiraceae bacterium]